MRRAQAKYDKFKPRDELGIGTTWENAGDSARLSRRVTQVCFSSAQRMRQIASHDSAAANKSSRSADRRIQHVDHDRRRAHAVGTGRDAANEAGALPHAGLRPAHPCD
jgi:hypothetical protein